MPRLRSLLFVLLLMLLAAYPLAGAQDLPLADGPQFDVFSVTEVVPAPNTEAVATDTLVTVVFNRPAVPLSLSQDVDTLPDPLTIMPEVAGEGRWLNTSIYVFEPETGFAGGTQYTLAVDGFSNSDGAPIEPYRWQFVTEAPRVLRVGPQSMESAVGLDAPIEIEFNQPMQTDTVEAAFSLIQDGTGATVAGSFSWSMDDKLMMFQPNSGLALDSSYVAALRMDAVRAAGSDAFVLGNANWSFLTIPYPAYASTSPIDGAQYTGTYEGFVLNFVSPMDEDSIEGRIRIEPEPEFGVYGYYSSYNNSYRINFEAKPSTDYVITVEPGMTDVYGNAIEQGLTVRYNTRARDPEVALQTPGEVGFYNAYADAIELYLSYLNVSRVDMNLYSAPITDFVATLTDDDYAVARNYTPRPDSLLRQWYVDGASLPLDQRRYDLMDMGASDVGSAGGVQSCEGALPSRVAVGDIAIVTSEPDPLRARSAPVDGEIVDLLYRDYQFEVVSGPTCADGIPWFEVRLRDNSTAWVAESVGDEYFMDVRLAANRVPVPVTTDDAGGPLAPGLYFVEARSPEIVTDRYPRHFMMVSTANVTMKYAMGGALAWVTDTQTAQPLSGLPVQFYGPMGTLYGTAVTDDDGLAALTYARKENLREPLIAIVQTENHFGVGADNWANGIEPYMLNVSADYYPDMYRAYLYTDRPIYRPNQPVYYRGIVRQRDDLSYPLPSFGSVPLQFYDGDGELVYETTTQLDDYGAFSGTFMLAEDAEVGSYRLTVRSPLDPDSTLTTLYFPVAEYRLPAYQVDVDAPTDAFVLGEDWDVSVAGRYYSGGSVSNANVTYTVQAQPYRFRYTGEGRYSFNTYSGYIDPYYYGMPVANGETQTDADGEANITLSSAFEDIETSQTLTFEANVSDESGVVVANRTQVVAHKSLAYVGVSVDRYVLQAGETATANLIAVDWDSTPLEGQSIEVIVEQLRWSLVQEVNEFGGIESRTEREVIELERGTVTTDAEGLASYAFVPSEGGSYQVRAVLTDARGTESESSTNVWVSSRDNRYVTWRSPGERVIELVADAEMYNVGDTAKILIASPYQGASEALVTVERAGVMSTQRVSLTGNSALVDVPILADYAPNVFVSVMLVKGVDENNPFPSMRYGVVQLNVNNEQRLLSIDVTSDTEQAGPGDTVTYTVQTTDYQGRGVSAQVGVGLTDLASLSIAPSTSGPIVDAFYGVQRLGVRTSSPLTINADEYTAYIEDVVKGGGGGGGFGGIFEIRSDFLDTAYWDGSLLTDANGQAQFQVTLPDNLTTWRLDARGLTQGLDAPMLVGQETFDLLATKPLLVMPVTPRFFVVGDEAELSAVVRNNTGATQTVEAFIESEGFALLGDNAQTQTIADGARARFVWRGRVEDVERLAVTFFAASDDGQYTDASAPVVGDEDDQTLPVYRYAVPETVATAGTVDAGESVTESIQLPANAGSDASVTVNVNTSLAGTTLDGLDYLRNYPHQCTEQTVSRFLPNIVTYGALARLDVADPALKADLDTQVNSGLQTLNARQQVDGGWGWFTRDSSDPLVTAYALMGLVEAQRAGYAVDPALTQGAIGYLRANPVLAGVPELGGQDWQYNREAVVLYALSYADVPEVARMSNLFDRRERLSVEGRAFLALALHRVGPDDVRVVTLTNEILGTSVMSATGTHWQNDDRANWSTDTRTTAVVLKLLVATQPDSELISNAVRYLVAARTFDRWETTQETAWAVMALTDWMAVSGELQPNYTYSVAANGATLLSETAQVTTLTETQTLIVDAADLLRDALNTVTLERSAGDGQLYYTAYLDAALPVADVTSYSRGVSVVRQYVVMDASGAEIGMYGDGEAVEARVGDRIEARLTVVVPNDMSYMVVDDPIPAGAEPIDPNLLTNTQLGTRPELSREDYRYGWGWWWFSEIAFQDERVSLYSAYLPAGTYEFSYEMRATVPGTYNVIPPTAQAFYFPEIYGRGSGTSVTIRGE